MLFLLFDPFPMLDDFFGIRGLGIAEDMRMTADQFFGEIPEDGGQFEAILVTSDLGIQDDLKQQISEFLLQHGVIIGIDCFEKFVSLFQRMRAD